MDKFAIDLDKVLDDFEINEDREERLAAGKVPYSPNYSIANKPTLMIANEGQNPVIPISKFEADQQFPSQAQSGLKDCGVVWSSSTASTDTSCEDGKPDLLDSVKSPQTLSQQESSKDLKTLDGEGSLPDVTVLTRPSYSKSMENEPQESGLYSLDDDTVCHLNKALFLPPVMEFSNNAAQFDHLNIHNFDSNLSSLPQMSKDLSNRANTSELEDNNQQYYSLQPSNLSSSLYDMASFSLDSTTEYKMIDANSGFNVNQPIENSVITIINNKIVPNNENKEDNILAPSELCLQKTESNMVIKNNIQIGNSNKLDSLPMFRVVTAEIGQNLQASILNHPVSKSSTPVGFTATDELSDSELERMLDELEADEYLTKPEEQQQISSDISQKEGPVQPDSNNDNQSNITYRNYPGQTFQDNLCLSSTSDQVYCEDGMQEISQASLSAASSLVTSVGPAASTYSLPSKPEQETCSVQLDCKNISTQAATKGDISNDKPLECLEIPRPETVTLREFPREPNSVDEKVYESIPVEENPNETSMEQHAAANPKEQDDSCQETQPPPTTEDEEEKPHRPRSLQLSSEDAIPYPPGSTVTVGPPGNTPGSNVPAASGMSYTIPEEISTPAEGYEASPSASSSSSTSSSGAEEASALEESRPPSLLQSLGVVPPYWVPDAEAPVCMHCETKFTVIKRRHHCRACGKVLCSRCCGHRARLPYLDNSEARVCQSCYPILCAAQDDDSGSNNNSPQRLGRSPNPNNPMEYCSTIPPLQQAGGSRNQRPPSVMVPVGVLKREGSSRNRGEPKQVMFSDGIRPGGDLTELDGWAESRLPRRQGRQARRIGTPPGPLPSPATNASTTTNSATVQGLRVPEVPEYRPCSVELRSQSNTTGNHGVKALVPSDLASYTLLADSRPGAFSFELTADMTSLIDTLRNENEPPVVFALNKNLFVLVKIVTLSCCVHKTVWCFTTRGLRCEGQDEMVFILEALPDEKSVPRDVFAHISAVYLEAGKGNTVTELGHTTFHGPFLGSSEHGGFLYIRPTSQCLQRLILPPPPYLVAVLLQRWEAPWARLFPLRLVLRLGYEFRYYPCPLVSVRERRPVYCELGQTILDLLADFRNFSFTLPCIQGLVIHMEDKQTSLLIPKNRYDQVVRVLNNSNDHVLALGGSFSRDADSHLVCVQADDETYHSKAISILNRPRKVTGASFLIFNGALKSSSGLSAKSSIVEDGLMVQVPADTMQSIHTALREMKDFSVGCGPASVQPPAETVLIQWVDDDRHFNVGVRSQIDGSKLDGVPSIRVHNGTDYRGENCFIRWTEVFLLKCEEGGGGRVGAELDISRVSESISRAFCVALVPLLDLLAAAGLLILAVRATLDSDNVGYEAGSNGERLPPLYMRSLDDELVPVIHQATSQSGEGKTVLELVFSVMRH